LTGAETEGSTIPEAVPVEALARETQGAAGAAPELAEVAGGEAPAMAGEERDDILPESTLEVIVRSPEIQDAEPIRSATMPGAATSSHGGIELLADDLIDPAAVARHLEAMCQAEQWMKVSRRYPWVVNLPHMLSTQVTAVVCCRMSWRDPDENLTCSKDTATQCSGRRPWKDNS
jgi:hypothetical protein